MVRIQQSLKEFLWRFHREKLPLIMMGHFELYEEVKAEYFDWLKTDDGKSYLKGGSNYDPEQNYES